MINNTDFDVVSLGSGHDRKDCNRIAELVSLDNCRLFNKSGETNFMELVHYIRHAAILISNDTSAAHIGVATDTKVVTISNGQHIGRFSPYPQDVYSNNIAVYPPAIQNQLDKQEEISSFFEKYRYGSDLNINDIDPFLVIKCPY